MSEVHNMTTWVSSAVFSAAFASVCSAGVFEGVPEDTGKGAAQAAMTVINTDVRNRKTVFFTGDLIYAILFFPAGIFKAIDQK